MQQYFINNNSDNLILFFTGWGCDEYGFEHLGSNSDILLLYNYSDLAFKFDFSKYNEINLLAYSAGVFVASVLNFNFKINRKIALSGNPYLFDEKIGISKKIQEVLCNVTEENADEFAKNYLIKTDLEQKRFHNSKRTIESCMAEFNSLKKIYEVNKSNIKDIFDTAIFGEDDVIFNVMAQKEFFRERLNIVKNARHNMFFRINSYEDVLGLI